MSTTPDFNFRVPTGYRWLIERGLVGDRAHTALQPWHYLPREHVFDVVERWPDGPSTSRLVAFAKRQDSDELACFEVLDEVAGRVVVVHGWTTKGYRLMRSYDNFWDWLKAVVDDIQRWVERGDSPEDG